MKPYTKQFQNVYGYPTLTSQVYKSLKDKFNVVVGVESLFLNLIRDQKKITIVIDGFAKLRACGVPILGYTATPSMVYVRSAFKLNDIVPNKATITKPSYLNGSTTSARPTISMLIAFNKCKTKEDYEALQSKYIADVKDPKLPKFKWLRRVLNQALKEETETKERQDE